MHKLLTGNDHVYQLGDYAILQNGDDSYEYVSWQIDRANGKMGWVRGIAGIFDDVLGLMSITSEGEEEIMETQLEVKYELGQLPKWDKTKFFCVIVLGQEASFLCYSETGSPVEENGEDFNTARDILNKRNIDLLYKGAIGFEAKNTCL